jgi:glycosyltransferase involved in cell wall biosynthesis
METIPLHERSIVSVGRLVPVKQFDLLIKACAQIPGCTLTLVGEGPQRQYLADLAKELEVELRLPGALPNEALPMFIQRHGVFAMTSRREGHPKALIEAMACGMACLGTNVPGIQGTMDHDNGLRVENTLDAIKNGIMLLLEDAPLRTRLGAAAREFVEQNLSFFKCFESEFTAVSELVHRGKHNV